MLMEGRGQQGSRAWNGTKPTSPQVDTFSPKVHALADRARRIRNEPLKTLMHVVDREWLQEAWKRLRKGGAVGLDHVTTADYEQTLDTNLDQVLNKLQHNQYRATPVRRVYIPKADGRLRPLGILTVEDKLVQRAIELILTPIYEQEFLPMSYGFRPGRSAHQAIAAVKAVIATKPVGWVVDVDLHSFFDELDHAHLRMFLQHRIADQRILRLIGKWLTAGVLEEGKLERMASGAPQGAGISPLLANVYLHYVLDLWVTKIVPKYLRGEIWAFRYADDVLFCFHYRSDALKFLTALRKRLAKFGLRLNEAKTKLCRFGRFAERDRRERGEARSTFTFLGFTFYNRLSRQGKYTVGTKTAGKRLRGCMTRLTQWCKENRHQAVDWQARYLNAVLRGHYYYYGVTGNFRAVAAFYRHTVRQWHRYLSRRSQRSYILWEKFEGILARHPLLRPTLPHSIYVPRP